MPDPALGKSSRGSMLNREDADSDQYDEVDCIRSSVKPEMIAEVFFGTKLSNVSFSKAEFSEQATTALFKAITSEAWWKSEAICELTDCRLSYNQEFRDWLSEELLFRFIGAVVAAPKCKRVEQTKLALVDCRIACRPGTIEDSSGHCGTAPEGEAGSTGRILEYKNVTFSVRPETNRTLSIC